MNIKRLKWLAILAVTSSLIGCGESENLPSQATAEEEIRSMMQTQPVSLTPQQVAEAFALGSDATDLQRDILKKVLIGNVIEWDVPVYEIQLEDGIYKITSQPIRIRSKQATELLRVVAFVYPQNEQDIDLLYKIKTNNIIKVRGKVRDIIMRTALVVSPGLIYYYERE